MLPGLRSLCTSGSGLAWWRKRSPVPISAAIRNLCCQGSTGVFPRRKRQSSKLPLAMYSYTRQPYSGHAPRRRTMFGCRMQLRTSICITLPKNMRDFGILTTKKYHFPVSRMRRFRNYLHQMTWLQRMEIQNLLDLCRSCLKDGIQNSYPGCEMTGLCDQCLVYQSSQRIYQNLGLCILHMTCLMFSL